MDATTESSPDGDLALERLKHTFDSAPVGIAHVDPKGVLIDVNPAFCKMLGYPREELCGRSFQQFTHPEDVAPNVTLLERLGSGRARWFNDHRIVLLFHSHLFPESRCCCAVSVAVLVTNCGSTPHFKPAVPAASPMR